MSQYFDNSNAQGRPIAKKRYSTEQFIQLLCEVEIHTSEGKTIAKALRQIGLIEQLRDELLNGEIFTSLKGGTNSNREMEKRI